jgi:hypothetical protein
VIRILIVEVVAERDIEAFQVSITDLIPATLDRVLVHCFMDFQSAILKGTFMK